MILYPGSKQSIRYWWYFTQNITIMCWSSLQTIPSFVYYSLRYGLIPTGWKVHKIVPVFKAGDPSSVKKYCPISQLPIISKVLEHLVFNKIISQVNTSLSPLQFGFTENSSALQQMLLFMDSIVNHPSQTDVIYLDISKAFDTDLIVSCWISCGTSVLLAHYGYSLRITYLIVIRECQLITIFQLWCPEFHKAVSWVQIYMNDITSFISNSQMYADDTKCFKHVSSVTDQTHLQEDINAILTRSKLTQLNFNIFKCTYISFKPHTIYQILLFHHPTFIKILIWWFIII